MSLTRNHVFAGFIAEIHRSRAWLADRFRPACGYTADVLCDRIAQRLVELGMPAYARAVKERSHAGTSPFPSAGTAIDCGPVSFTIGSGRVTVSASTVARGTIEFLSHWFYVLVTIVAAAWTRRTTSSGVLIFDLAAADVFAGQSDAAFVAFCRAGPIASLREARRCFVEADPAGVSTAPDAFVYCRRPLVSLLREARLGPAGRASLIGRHLALLLTYHVAVFRMPALSLVAREAPYSAAAAALDRSGALGAVVVTCSSYRLQPLWARGRRAKIHMVWYAQNWKPTVETADDVETDYPTTRWIRADVHWVWTESFARYLRTQFDADVRAVGPLLWRLPDTRVPEPGRTSVLVFDVPAVSDQVMLDLNGEVTNYLRAEYLQAFLADVAGLKGPLETAAGEPVTITLKMKRGFRPDYSRQYFDYVDQLVSRGVIGQTAGDQSLFEMISGSRLVIAYPFTSPAYVAEFLGVPAIYYDPTHTVRRHDFSDRAGAVEFAGNARDLERLAVAALRQDKTLASSHSSWSRR